MPASLRIVHRRQCTKHLGGRRAAGGSDEGGLVAPRCRRPQLTGARRKKGTHQKTQVRKSHATWDAIEKRNDDVALRKPTR